MPRRQAAAPSSPPTLKLSVSTLVERHPATTFLLISAGLVLFVYWQAFSSPFLYDDLEQIVNNQNLASWTLFFHKFFLQPVTLTTSLLSYKASIYRPVFWTSLYLDYLLWGRHAGGFHATNLALHLANANLAFNLLRKLKVAALAAAAVALLWLSLPINVEAVDWISARSYELCALFLLICLLSVLNRLRGGSRLWTLVCFVSAACSTLSHELGFIVPLLLPLLKLRTESRRSSTWPGIIGALCAAEIGVAALRFAVAVKTFSAAAALRWACLALLQYVTLTLFPLHMSVERSTTLSKAQPFGWLLAIAPVFLFILGYAVYVRRRYPSLLAGLLWFLLCISPFCVLMNYQGVAERFTYLASLGLVVSVVSSCSIPKRLHTRRVLMAGVTLWGAWDIYRTKLRVLDWSEPVRLYRSSLQATPRSPLLRYNLAFSLMQEGKPAQALKEYQELIALDRRYPQAFAGLGNAYLQLGMASAAQAAYTQALSQTPEDVSVLLNSAVAFQSAGALEEAESSYRKVLQLDPHDSPAHVDLGVLYLKEKRSNEAVHEFAMAIDGKTKDPTPYYDLAVLLQQAGRGDLAAVLYKKVLELQPNDKDALQNLRGLGQAP